MYQGHRFQGFRNSSIFFFDWDKPSQHNSIFPLIVYFHL